MTIPRGLSGVPRAAAPALVLAALLAVGCSPATDGSVPSAPAGSAAAAAPTPSPCFDPLQCPATPGPVRTMPPDPTIAPTPRTASPDVFRIAIGSCLRNPDGGEALEDILAAEPHLMLWLGDNVYADTDDMARMRALYDRLGANPRFQALAATTEMMAVWDDHDFGSNNANSTWPHRDAAKSEFLRFWGSPDDSRADQPGVYSARTFGAGDRTVQVILLDNRYNLDPWDYDGTDPGAEVLGEQQWAWLQERLLEPATIRIVGSGVQVVNDYDIDAEWEGWGDSPLQRQKLFDLIRGLGVSGVVFVSGDMHFAELTRHPDDAAALGYPTYDLTPSGLDQIEWWGFGQWHNPNRVGELLNSGRKHGLVEINWRPTDPEIHLRIHNGRQVHLHHVVRLSELQPR